MARACTADFWASVGHVGGFQLRCGPLQRCSAPPIVTVTQMVTTLSGGRQAETPAEREARVRRLAQLVKQGTYVVETQHLAAALLEWDPRRVTARGGDADAPDRRRAYMRDYMRRRRSGAVADTAVIEDNVSATLVRSTGPPGLTGLPGP
jgi:hypothetical protein